MPRLSIAKKLLLAFFLIGLVPFSIVSLLSVLNATSALESAAFKQLETVREIKKSQIKQFFFNRRSDMSVLSDMVAALRQEAVYKLVSVRKNKSVAIDQYFSNMFEQAVTLSNNRSVVGDMQAFNSYFRQYRSDLGLTEEQKAAYSLSLRNFYSKSFLAEYAQLNEGRAVPYRALMGTLDENAVAAQYSFLAANPNSIGEKHKLYDAKDGSRYAVKHRKVHGFYKDYARRFGLEDILFVDAGTGNVVYSINKNVDFAATLKTGIFSSSPLGKVYQKALALKDGEYAFQDYETSIASFGLPASFVAAPIKQNGNVTGILVFKLSLERITEVMSERSGLGNTGETILVGPDYLMRSDAYHNQSQYSVLNSFRFPDEGQMKNEVTSLVLEEQREGISYLVDYRNKPTIAAYTPILIGDVRWALLAKIDISEALVPYEAQTGTDFYSNYTAKYGYNDLILFNPDGTSFFSVNEGPGYAHDFLNGDMQQTNLGSLVASTIDSLRYGLVDFKPFPKANNEPAGFIAQPITHEGKVELIVALQLSIESINELMSQKTDEEASGQIYLVGEDGLMRSDAVKYPDQFSVSSSFGHPEKNKVETESC